MVEARTLEEQLRAAADAGPRIVHVPAHWLRESEWRLDATYYSSDSARARLALEALGRRCVPLADVVTKCFLLGRFKRIYADSPTSGWPYLSAHEAFQFRPSPYRWIARRYAPRNPKAHFVEEGWILVSASGSVGRPLLVGDRLPGWFLSHDLVRIVPSNLVPSGYLYAYLASWIGQALLQRDQYGSNIKHLESHHVADLPVPLLADADMERIADKVVQAQRYRSEANQLLDAATAELYRELKLPATLAESGSSRQAFATHSLDLHGRFDASFHDPMARLTVDTLRAGPYVPLPLSEVCSRIFYPSRFKRNYVAPEYGVPFLQGSHIPLVRPFGMKYLSLTDERNLRQCRVDKNWVLVTCSGTIGRVGLVSSVTAGWAASQHILRLVARPGNNPGYMALFLMTPYGGLQLQSRIYGAVVDELTYEDLGTVLIPNAPPSVQDVIGDKVLSAFELKDQAALQEDEAIRDLEALLSEG